MKAMALVLACFVSLQAAHAQAPQPLTADGVANMDCNDATRALQNKLALYQQLSQAFLQSNQTLEEVYKTWGERLAQIKDPTEVARVAEYFSKSAETLSKSRAQNEQMIAALKQETDWLSNRAAWCAGHTGGR